MLPTLNKSRQILCLRPSHLWLVYNVQVELFGFGFQNLILFYNNDIIGSLYYRTKKWNMKTNNSTTHALNLFILTYGVGIYLRSYDLTINFVSLVYDLFYWTVLFYNCWFLVINGYRAVFNLDKHLPCLALVVRRHRQVLSGEIS